MTIFDYEDDKLSEDNFSESALLQDVPFDLMYEAARKEASRKKPVFFIHKYFARRITCNFRMMLLGALLSKEDSIWDEMYRSHNNCDLKNVTILDPFMGGGTAIFEALRLNTQVIGCDLQPLSKFVTKALIQDIDAARVRKAVKEVEFRVAHKIMKYYKTCCPECNKSADLMYTFHVKTVKTETFCEEHMLFSNFVLAVKKETFTLVCPECGEVYEHNFKEKGVACCPFCNHAISSPKEGYVKHGHFHCAKCGEDKVLSDYKADSGYPFRTKPIALEYYCPHCKSHGYKRADLNDLELYKEACSIYDEMKGDLPIPFQPIPLGYNTKQILNHGYKRFSDLFNKRQLLCLGLLLQAINELEDKESQFWLQLAFSGMLEMNNMFCRYQANAYKICNIFFNHAYAPITMPVENNVWGTKLGTGNFTKTIEKILRGKKFCTQIYDVSTIKSNKKVEVVKKYSDEKVQAYPVDDIKDLGINKPVLHCGDSKNLSFIKDESVDIVLTDPPFGANVMYSELIDFFHVWNFQSSIGKELGFVEPLSPKKEEIVVNTVRNKTQEDYSHGLQEVFKECNRVLKKTGFLIFSYHDKCMESWISLLGSVDKSGFVLQKAYPLHAETRTGAHTSNKNSIALDIMLIFKKKPLFNIVCYKQRRKKIITYVYEETEKILKKFFGIDAEITKPDVENILISQFFTACAREKTDFDEVLQFGLTDIKQILADIPTYFSSYNFSAKRTGWWSELFNKKWDI